MDDGFFTHRVRSGRCSSMLLFIVDQGKLRNRSISNDTVMDCYKFVELCVGVVICDTNDCKVVILNC